MYSELVLDHLEEGPGILVTLGVVNQSRVVVGGGDLLDVEESLFAAAPLEAVGDVCELDPLLVGAGIDAAWLALEHVVGLVAHVVSELLLVDGQLELVVAHSPFECSPVLVIEGVLDEGVELVGLLQELLELLGRLVGVLALELLDLELAVAVSKAVRVEHINSSVQKSLWLEAVRGASLIALVIHLDIFSSIAQGLENWSNLLAEVKGNLGCSVLVKVGSLLDDSLLAVYDVLGAIRVKEVLGIADEVADLVLVDGNNDLFLVLNNHGLSIIIGHICGVVSSGLIITSSCIISGSSIISGGSVISCGSVISSYSSVI